MLKRPDIARRRDRRIEKTRRHRRVWGDTREREIIGTREDGTGEMRVRDREGRGGETGRHRCAGHRVGARSLIGQPRYLLLAFFSSPSPGKGGTWNLGAP